MQGTAQRIAVHLGSLKVVPGVSYVMRDSNYEPTGEYFVTSDLGLFVGQESLNDYGSHLIKGTIVPWEMVKGVSVELEGLKAEDGPYTLKVVIDEPKFDVTWSVDQRVSARTDRDELAAFLTDVLRRKSRTAV